MAGRKPMADKLIINNLAVGCRIGVFEWEQNAAQTILIDLELAIDASRAARRDDVKATIDYGALVTAVRQLVQSKSYRLLETLAEEVAAFILNRFKTPSVLVRIKKRALPGIDYAAVELTRKK